MARKELFVSYETRVEIERAIINRYDSETTKISSVSLDISKVKGLEYGGTASIFFEGSSHLFTAVFNYAQDYKTRNWKLYIERDWND